MLRRNRGYKEQVKRAYNDKDIHVSISAKILYNWQLLEIIITLVLNSRFSRNINQVPNFITNDVLVITSIFSLLQGVISRISTQTLVHTIYI
jgi:hypothetical protein